MAQVKNLPLETDFYPNHTKPKEYDRPHVFVNNEYVSQAPPASEYPKVKYHKDFVPNPVNGKDYGFNQVAQLVNNAEDEKRLGDDWKDSPADHGIVTAPNQQEVDEKRRSSAADWKAAAKLPGETVTERHIEFVQSQGMIQVTNIVELYKFLGELTGSQMTQFMKDAQAWFAEQDAAPKRGRKAS
jgi:hypothetical protein